MPPSSRAPVRTKSEGMMDRIIIQVVDLISSLSWRVKNMAQRTVRNVAKIVVRRKWQGYICVSTVVLCFLRDLHRVGVCWVAPRSCFPASGGRLLGPSSFLFPCEIYIGWASVGTLLVPVFLRNLHRVGVCWVAPHTSPARSTGRRLGRYSYLCVT